MDIKEGHPGSVFNWFFDTDQGTDNRAQFLVMLYGSRPEMTALMEGCLKAQPEFDDALGPEILFLFFDPNIRARDLTNDGQFLNQNLIQDTSGSFLFAGYGEAHAVPAGMIELGHSRFRSERPGCMYFDEIATAAVKAHGRAIPFFQQAFHLEPRQNGLIFAHRRQRQIFVYEIDDNTSLSVQDLINLFTSMRKVARHSRGAADLTAIDEMISAHLARAFIKKSASLVWNSVRNLFKILPKIGG